MSQQLILRLILALLHTLIIIVGGLLIIIRLGGVLFFLSSMTVWSVVPALTIAGLLALLLGAVPPKLSVCMGLLFAYLLSVYYFVWEDVLEKLADNRWPIFEFGEAGLIFILTAYCVALSRRK